MPRDVFLYKPIKCQLQMLQFTSNKPSMFFLCLKICFIFSTINQDLHKKEHRNSKFI